MSRIRELRKEIEKEENMLLDRAKAIILQTGIVEEYNKMATIKINKELLPGISLKGTLYYDNEGDCWTHYDAHIVIDNKLKTKENKWFLSCISTDLYEYDLDLSLLIPKENLSFMRNLDKIFTKLAKENDIDEDDLRNVWADMVQNEHLFFRL